MAATGRFVNFTSQRAPAEHRRKVQCELALRGRHAVPPGYIPLNSAENRHWPLHTIAPLCGSYPEGTSRHSLPWRRQSGPAPRGCPWRRWRGQWAVHPPPAAAASADPPGSQRGASTWSLRQQRSSRRDGLTAQLGSGGAAGLPSRRLGQRRKGGPTLKARRKSSEQTAAVSDGTSTAFARKCNSSARCEHLKSSAAAAAPLALCLCPQPSELHQSRACQLNHTMLRLVVQRCCRRAALDCRRALATQPQSTGPGLPRDTVSREEADRMDQRLYQGCPLALLAAAAAACAAAAPPLHGPSTQAKPAPKRCCFCSHTHSPGRRPGGGCAAAQELQA